MPTVLCSDLGHIIAAQHEAAACAVLLHCASQAVLGLRAQPVHLIQHQHLEASLALQINGPALCHVLQHHTNSKFSLHVKPTMHSLLDSLLLHFSPSNLISVSQSCQSDDKQHMIMLMTMASLLLLQHGRLSS